MMEILMWISFDLQCVLTGWWPDTRPQSQGLCRGHFLSCAGFLHGHLQPATLMSPCIKTSLATDVLSVRLLCCIPFFPYPWEATQKLRSIARWLLTVTRKAELLGMCYVQPDLTRSQYTWALTNQNDSTFWPGRSLSAKALFETFLMLRILLVNAPRLTLSMIYECKYAKQIPNKTTGT